MNKDVKLLQLVSGENIIAQVTIEKDASEVILDNPVMIVPHNNDTGFMPWPIFSNSTRLDLNPTHIVFIVDVQEEILQGYNDNIIDKKTIEVVNKPGLIY